MAADFLSYKEPFTNLTSDLLQHFENADSLLHSIPAYPLFLTKDYCNMIHSDNDRSIYTMFLSSNPSMDLNGGYLVIVDYGIKIMFTITK